MRETFHHDKILKVVEKIYHINGKNKMQSNDRPYEIRQINSKILVPYSYHFLWQKEFLLFFTILLLSRFDWKNFLMGILNFSDFGLAYDDAPIYIRTTVVLN